MKNKIKLPRDWVKWIIEHEKERAIFDEIILPLILPAVGQIEKAIDNCWKQLTPHIQNSSEPVTLDDLLHFIQTFHESERRASREWSTSYVIAHLQLLVIEVLISRLGERKTF